MKTVEGKDKVKVVSYELSTYVFCKKTTKLLRYLVIKNSYIFSDELNSMKKDNGLSCPEVYDLWLSYCS